MDSKTITYEGLIVTVEETLQGSLVTMANERHTIKGIVNEDRWFFKVKLLSAYGLNYDWAKEMLRVGLANYKGKL